MAKRDCIRHTGTPAIGQCYLCHKPICEECRFDTPSEGIFCGQECYDKYIAYQGRKQPLLRSPRLKSMAIGLLIIIVLAAAAIYLGGALGLPVLKPIRDAILPGARRFVGRCFR